MGYAIYDKKKNKFPFKDDAPYKSEKSAKRDIVATIYGAFSTGKYNDAIYYFENYIVKGVGENAVVPKLVRTANKPSTTITKRVGRPKKLATATPVKKSNKKTITRKGRKFEYDRIVGKVGKEKNEKHRLQNYAFVKIPNQMKWEQYVAVNKRR
jgi:hypothetical protein